MKLSQYRGFGKTFWSSIVAEIFERGAWYGFFSLAALYLVGPTSEGALGFNHAEKAAILGIVPFFVYLVPIFSGTIGDKIGYKKMLLASFAVLAVGYYSMSFANSYYSVLGFFMLVALGAGMFKPMISSTVTKVTRGDKDKSSVGFAIFYMMINLGGFFGPIITGMFRPSVVDGVVVSGSWSYVFYISSAYMVSMFFWVLFTYQEPNRDKDAKNLGTKLLEMVTDLKDWRLTILLFIFMGFWAMFNQLFITLPTWIVEWVDTSSLASIPFLPESWFSEGQMKPEYLINLDAAAIIAGNVLVAALVAKRHILKTITVGILVCSLSLAGLVLASNQWGGHYGVYFLLAMIVLFAIGEMMSSPKFTEMMGLIAPKNKIGTYQGYGFLSVAGGNLLGGWLSGLYGSLADKTGWYKAELVQRGLPMEEIDGLGLQQLGELLQQQGVNLTEFNASLWQTHQPYQLWLVYLGVGLATVVAMLIYRMFVPELGQATLSEEG